jgi:PST family polysaccharide transporter
MIFLFVKQTDDVVIYAAITIATTVFGSIAAMMILWRKYRIRLLWIPVNQLKIWYKDATPFFLTTSMNTIKQETAKVFIGTFFSMSDVALYDLAMKIYSVPTILISSINGAMFPKMITNIRKKVIQKILTIENCIGITVIILLAVFGKWIIVLMGSETMLDAYPLLVILSFGIFTPLTVGAIINFIFVPMHKYYLITKNQLIACIVFIVGALTGILMNNGGVIIVPIVLTLSCFAEIIFCYVAVKKIFK